MAGAGVTDRARLADLQRQRLEALFAVLPANRFYAPRLPRSPADLKRLPFTTKADLLADQQAHPPHGTVLTYPPQRYVRFNQTSGTSGQPLRWLDTPESWQWMLDCWRTIYEIVGVGPGDRLFFPFSFGPFLGFWTAYDSAAQLGCLCLPGGGMTSTARLRFLADNQANVVLCTPTYALHLAEVAAREGIDLPRLGVRALIVAGEPGGSIPATRQRIESAWGARVFDHSGLTEVGPMAVECPENPGGLHLLEGDYLAEVIDPETTEPVNPGEAGELVVTNLGRLGSPVLRYRTGDLVRVDPKPCPCGRAFRRLDGGILGRCDDMIHLRGNNVYPSALEDVIRRFPEVAEFRIEVDASSALTALRIEVEPTNGQADAGLAERVGQAIRDVLLFRAEVRAVAPGSLPRYEMKARRWKKT
ncbi:MAG: AMP-binding protein [Gemmataceae bacterium]|nr:AMP-binding protein [Gemmataceae bacterium]